MKLSRRKFFGAAAAVSVAAAVPGRTFARTLEDRVASSPDTGSLIFRLYENDRLVLEEERVLPVSGNNIGIGSSEMFTVDSTVNISRITVALPMLPNTEVPIDVGNNYVINPSDTLTLMADAQRGFLEVS